MPDTDLDTEGYKITCPDVLLALKWSSGGSVKSYKTGKGWFQLPLEEYGKCKFRAWGRKVMSSLGTRKDPTEREEAESRLADKVELKESSLGEETMGQGGQLGDRNQSHLGTLHSTVVRGEGPWKEVKAVWEGYGQTQCKALDSMLMFI